MRRQFDLLLEDQEFLESLGLPWEAINDCGTLWIIVHELPLLEGYIQRSASVAINLASGYPRAQLDMAYFYPPIKRGDNNPIGALANRQIDGKNWQRWSRHRTPRNPWREGIDNLSTHFALIEDWLEREFKLRPYAIPA